MNLSFCENTSNRKTSGILYGITVGVEVVNRVYSGRGYVRIYNPEPTINSDHLSYQSKPPHTHLSESEL